MMPEQSHRDEFLALEALQSPEVDTWVNQHNAITERAFKTSEIFKTLRTEALEVMGSSDKIPLPSLIGDWVYNFWRDEKHERGI